MNRLKGYGAIAICLLMGGFLIVDGWKELRNSWRLSREGRSTTGKVFDHSEFQWKRNATYYLSVDFLTADGGFFSKKLEVSLPVYQNAVASGKVTVHYLPT